MSQRALIILLFSILQVFACVSVIIPYHRDIASVLLVVLSVVGMAGAILFFILWKRPVLHGIFFLCWAVGLLIVFFVGWGSNWFTATPDEACLEHTAGVVPEAWLSESSVTTIPPNTGCNPNDHPIEGIPPYGEAFAQKGIFQPLSTLSDLAFIVSGFIIILLASLGARDAGATPPNESRLLPLGDNPAINWQRPFLWGLGLVVIFMGPASMYLHASFRDWAGWMDSFSVYNLGLLGFSYGVFRCIHYVWRTEVLAWVISLLLYLGLAIGFGIAGIDPGARIYLIATGIALWLTTEIALAIGFAVGFSGRGYFIAWGWGLIFLGLFATAGVFKFFVEETAKFTTAWQPHALFHLLAASALPFAYLYWASEKRPREE